MTRLLVKWCVACFLIALTSNTMAFMPKVPFGKPPRELPRRLPEVKNQYKFIENKNQWDKSVRYRADIPNGFLFLKENALVYGFYDANALMSKQTNHKHLLHEAAKVENLGHSHHPTHNGEIRGHGVEVEFVGANPSPQLVAHQATTEYYNYFLSASPDKWASNVRGYNEVVYNELYKGIQLKFYTQDEALKYDFVVAPYANPQQIRVSYNGAETVTLENGNLKIQTSINEFIEQHPYSYQFINGQKVEVPSRFKLENNQLSYEFPQGYHPQYELIIDPTLVFSSYSGSLVDNWGFSATFDNAENLYAAGIVIGQQFPVTVGAFDVTHNVGWDIAVMKFNSTGSNLLYATFLGGLESELPSSMIVNSAGNLVIEGVTGSPNFPTSSNAFDRTFNGGTNFSNYSLEFPFGSDIFITIFNPTGTSLVASTYVGGGGNDGYVGVPNFPTVYPLFQNYGDEARGEVYTDAAGSVYVASYTRSNNFPTFNGGNGALPFGGSQDAVAFRMNADLSAMTWGAYIGGAGEDAAHSIRTDATGNIYVVGATTSNNLFTSATALQPTFRGGVDGFIHKYSPTGTFLRGTYIGTPQYDQTYFMDLDNTGNVYVLGNTRGVHPITAGAYNNANGGHFIYKLDNNLTTRIFSTQIGNANSLTPSITPTAFMVSDCENIYLAGWGGTTNGATTGIPLSTAGLPTTADAFRRTTDGDDFYTMVLGKNATQLLFATFFGGGSAIDGDHVDGGTCRFSKSGVIYHSACVCRSNNFPTTVGAWRTVNLAAPPPTNACNNLAFKISLDLLKVDFTPTDAATGTPITTTLCAPVTVRLRNNSTNATRFQWNLGTLGTSTDAEPTFTITQGGTYTFTLTGFNDGFCLTPQTVTRTINIRSTTFALSNNVTICQGASTQLTASGGTTYQWSPATGLSATNIANPIASPTTTTTYTVRISDGVCSSNLTTTVNVRTARPEFTVSLTDSCATFPLINIRNTSTVAPTNEATYFWDFGNGQTATVANPPPFKYTAEGTYTIRLTLFRGQQCEASTTQTVEVKRNANGIVPQISPNVAICQGDAVQLTASGGTTYQWSPATGLSATNIANPIATPTQTTTYRVRIANNVCAADTAVTVTVSPRVNPSFTAELSDLCARFPLVTLTNNTTGGLTYLWDFGNGQTSTLPTPPPFKYTVAGRYKIVLTATNQSCTRRDSTFVDIKENTEAGFEQKITISPTQKICNGETVQLTATGGSSYQWSPATGLSATNTATVSASPEVTTTYKVRIFANANCFKDTVVTVEVTPRINLDFTIEYDSLCEPYPVVRIISRVSGADSYVWSFGDGRTFAGIQPPSFKYDRDGDFEIKVTGTNANCTRSNSQISPQRRIIAADFYKGIRISPRNSAICNATTIQLSATGGARYLWTPATGLSNPNIGNPVASPTATTTYNVRIFNERGCFVDSAVRVEVVPEIKPAFEVQVASECGKNGVVRFTNKSTGADKFKWTMGNGKDVFDTPPTEFSYEKSGEYEVILEAMNGLCSKKVSQKIKVENIKPANVITPNGDGKNERFVIDNVREGWKLEIYDRWGKLVYKNDNYNGEWGEDTSSALYYYYLTSPEGKSCKGWIQVLRGEN